ALLIFQDIGDRPGAAQCLQSLSNLLQMESRYEEARVKLEEAMRQFQDIGGRLGAAQCLRSLGDILQMETRYEEARVGLE
ncbi:hypothetical protein NEOLEDRAFT_1037486, partial [Neolentinus lepideus HHB14362 ss-1]